MAIEISGLLVVNVAYLLVGGAALAAVGWLTADTSTWYRLGVAYPLGLVVVTIPASYLAVFRVPVSLTATAVALGIIVIAAARSKPWRATSMSKDALRLRGSRGGLAGGAIFLVLAVLLAYAARTFATRPFLEWDSWAIWMAKARLLYDDPSAAPAALRSGIYGQAPYPLGLPTVEALGFSSMGRFDGTVIGVQFLLLACAFPAALWSLLRARARVWMIALVALATVAAPQMLYQLLTRFADVPLGLFVGLGVGAGAAWVVSRGNERWLLGCFAAFLGMAGLTKNEGLLFALAGCVALAVATIAARGRRRIIDAAVAIAALLTVILPWRVYCAVYGLSTPDYNLGHAVDPAYLRAHTDRLGPTTAELWRQLTNFDNWGLLVWVNLLALVVGLVAAQWRLLTFAGTWLVLAAGGLMVTYWISVLPVESHLTNTSNRTIVSLLVGGAAMVPLFVFPRPADDGRRDP